MIRTTYPDRICYRPGCDVHECRILLGNPDGVAPDSDVRLGNPNGVAPDGSLHHAHADDHPCDVPSSPDIPHPEFCPGDVPPSPSVSHPADISGSADSAHPEDFAAILHSAAVFS